jgi:hypothetical protein
MSNLKEILSKTVGEIRFRPTLTSWDKTIEISRTLEKKFRDWRIDKNKDVTLFDKEEKILLKIQYNSIIILNEGKVDGFEKLISYTKTIFSKFADDADIIEFQHVGCRNISIIQTDFEKQDLTDLTFKKFYGNNEALKNISGNNILDTVFVLDSQKDELRNHVQIGPTLREQALQIFSQSFEPKDIPVDKNYLLVDVDVFKKENLTKTNIINTLDSVFRDSSLLKDTYIKYTLD